MYLNQITFLAMLAKILFTLLMVALGVGFFTLMERKVLSYIQTRKGPNKVGFVGLPQPLADAAKLFTKETILIMFSNKPSFVGAPAMAMIVMFLLWNIYMTSFSITIFKLSILFFLTVSSLNVYAILISGWASNSKYSLIGAIRAIAQTISYEVTMALILMNIILLTFSFNLPEMSKAQYAWFMVILSPLFIMWFTSCLAETNRAPFDLAEGESELVSGFNIEYGGGEFAFLFIAEYGSILLMSFITTSLFLSGLMLTAGIYGLIKMVIIAYLFLWVRGSYPRMRYDTLMSLTWKSFLASTLGIVMFILTLW